MRHVVWKFGIRGHLVFAYSLEIILAIMTAHLAD
jgi:hypothetical protein